MLTFNHAVFEKFDSIPQFLNAINTRKPNGRVNEFSHKEKDYIDDFFATRTYEEAENLILNGWDEHLADVKTAINAAAKSETKTPIPKSRPATGPVGYAPCVPNALLGLPNSMIATHKDAQKVKAITLVYNINVLAEFKASNVIKCGIAVVQIVNQLEKQGYRIKLVVSPKASVEGKNIVSCFVTVKDFRQPLDLKKILFPMIHPSMQRRFGFRFTETHPDVRGFYDQGGSIAYKYSYDEVSEYYRSTGALGKNDFYLTAYLVKDMKYDPEKIMDRIGLTKAVKGVV